MNTGNDVPALAMDSLVTAESESKIESDAEIIRTEGRFDLDWYCQQAGRELCLDEAIAHYVRQGERLGYSPSRNFDPRFYLSTNPDVERAGGNAYAHYLRFGRNELRYPTPQALRSDVLEALRSGHFDADHYRNAYFGADYSVKSSIEHFLLEGWRNGLRANPSFDVKFYFDAYPDVGLSGLHPFIHFVRIGAGEQRWTCFEQIQTDIAIIEDSSAFDADYYRTRHCIDDAEFEKLSPIAHYVVRGARRWFDPNPDFCTEYYLRRYPDLNQPRIVPFAHFLRYGRKEGRVAKPPSYTSVFRQAAGQYFASRPTLMVVVHECSRTGAPLLGLALVRELALRYNIVTWAGKHGVLAEDFDALAFLSGYGFPDALDCEFLLRDLVAHYPVDGVIVNSVETSPIHRAILACDIPSVGLLHEFAAYTLPPGRLSTAVSLLDRCIVPAEIVRRSALQEIETTWGGSANNLVVRPQGHLPRELWSLKFSMKDENDRHVELQMTERLKGKKVVLGAGFVHIRKGVDLFIEVARHIREIQPAEPVHFLWIGEGYAPRSDLLYSVWVEESLKKWGLEDRVTILDAQKSLDWAFNLADVFLLSSRLDPFPNVVVDAMAAGVPIVCFEQATGCAEFIHETGTAGAIVPYLDTRAAAGAILELIAEGHHRNENPRIVEERLAMKDYVEALERELDVARELAARRREFCHEIHETGWFDRTFYDSRWKFFPDDRAALREYVAHCMKGIYKLSPYPGFNDARYIEHHALSATEELPLIHAIRNGAGGRPVSHECIIVDNGRPLKTFPTSNRQALKVALHAHLFYPEVLSEFVRMLRETNISADLFISCSTAAQAREIEYHLHDYCAGRVTIRQVPNAGRDIGPFITEFGSGILTGGYDIAGHLHGKKSRMLGPNVGDAWRKYLWDNLLRGQGVWETVCDAFAGDPKLGLLFAEDRHVVGWGKNRALAQELLARFGLSCNLPAVPLFPLGTMFWCRPQAIAPVLDSGLEWSDYPGEPLPYDGTILHALERLLPTICEQTGYGWKTIYLRGTNW